MMQREHTPKTDGLQELKLQDHRNKRHICIYKTAISLIIQ